MPRTLLALPAPTVTPAQLRAALDGSGPALLPTAAGTAGQQLVAAMRPDEPLEYDDVALVVPTSGSTGEPKGVLLRAPALAASATATHERLGGAGQWLLALPLTHIAGLQVLVRSLLADTDAVLMRSGPFSCTAFVAATEALGSGRRYTSLVPTQLLRLVDDAAGRESLASYDAVLVGGAATPPALLFRAREAGIRVVATYGMSETCGGCVYDGVPLSGVGASFDDVGRIRLSGPTIAAGYRLRPDLTRAAFGPAGFTTNDLGRWDEQGRLEVLGRADDIIISGGENIAPTAVVAVLAAHPAVAEVVVLGAPDPEWGERVIAVVRLHDGAVLALDDAREHVASGLSKVAAPREVHVLDALPLLASGKPDRALLKARFAR
ncbi:MAG: o-succinylbenzoate---CoA ligase [Actinomycetota bacterium]|jgi:O-succinylbenzoic acid--CoA ligase|nr:o-succinylbenzoate---CoA ligase [Actinomycetota bacterium]